MKLYMPTEIYNEKNCVVNHSRDLAALGKNAFIVTGKHSSRINGSLNDVTAALEQEGIVYEIFDSVEENPSVDTVMKARDLGIRCNAEFVIGVGGGSPMDASKAIALMIANPEQDADILYAKAGQSIADVRKALPVVCVPTTAGTGSEVTPYSILTRETAEGQKAKQSIAHRIFPVLALVDADYLQTASRSTCVNTAVDTLAHLIESQLNTNTTDYSRFYSETGLRTWAKIKDSLIRYEIGEEERKLLMHACTLGGMAIAHTQTSIPHGLSYTLTSELGIPHGKAAGIFLPGYLKIYDDKDAVADALSLLGFEDVQAFEEYIRQLLGEVEISDEMWGKDVEGLLQNPSRLNNYPFPIDREKLAACRYIS